MERKRNKQVNIRMTAEEKSHLLEKSAATRMSMSDYILALSENKKIVVVENLPRLVLEITRIGVNINQVAAVANSKKTVDSRQIDFLLVSLKEVRKLLDKILDECCGVDDEEM